MARDLDELRAFVAAARTGSVRAAADELDLSRSMLRRRIAAFEQRVGVTLLWYDASGCRPTPAGRRVMAEGEPLLRAHGDLIQRVRDGTS